MLRCTQVAVLGAVLFAAGTILLLLGSVERVSLIYWLGGPLLGSAGFVMFGVGILWRHWYRRDAGAK